MGTTVATNALLERKGERTAARHHTRLPRRASHRLPGPARHLRQGDRPARTALRAGRRSRTSACAPTAPWNAPSIPRPCEPELQAAKAAGIDAVAIVFMHAWKIPEHERQAAALARELGFGQVSASHEVSPLAKLVGRGDTTVVDAYLSPILRRYVDQVAAELGTRLGRAGRPLAAVHDVLGRSDGSRDVPGQGCDPLRTGRRRRRHGRDRTPRRLRSGHRLRHGRHVHRRRPFRRRL